MNQESATALPAQGQSTTDPDERRIRTAVVIVHGMGEQVPLETVNQFVKTALPKSDDRRHPTGPKLRQYFSRPDQVAGSYEARRMEAYRQPFDLSSDDPLVHGSVDFYEYHWSYKMQGNKLSDFVPTLARFMLRRRRNVPEGLRVVWLMIWGVLAVVAVLVLGFALTRAPDQRFGVEGVVLHFVGLAFVGAAVAAVLAPLITAVIVWLLRMAGNTITAYFVDVARYLDRSPRSYLVRRDIRDGMVSLLRGLHQSGRYQRVVLVAHSLGGYIAYDGLTSLWSEYFAAHAGPIRTDRRALELPYRTELEAAGRSLKDAWADGRNVEKELAKYRALQFEAWKALRMQGNPWLITDFITLGTPMYFADLLYTKNRKQFQELVHRAELPVCPPTSRRQMVERDTASDEEYAFKSWGRYVFYHAAPFAVVRWTNLYFRAEKSFHGDWFGGPLRDLFGAGVLDVSVTGNTGANAPTGGPRTGYSTPRKNRRTPGAAHGYYFRFYEEDSGEVLNDLPIDITPLLQHFLDLTMERELAPLLAAPEPLPETMSDAASRTRGGFRQ